MDPVWLLLLLPLAAAGGWYMAMNERNRTTRSRDLPESYFKGLSFLLNEQPDKALRVFLEVVEVDKETVEMHLALGNLFRRLGEVGRATRIHQNLVARSDLDDSLRSMALFELAQDYFKAGLFDRAENLFQELRQVSEYREPACRFLLQIYDQEKEWKNAIWVAEELGRFSEQDYSSTIAHYNCELAEGAISEGNNQIAEGYLESAFKKDMKCIRAVSLSGRIASMRGNHAHAIAIWSGLAHSAPEAIGEVVGHVANSYRQLGDKKSLVKFLESALEKNPDPRIIAKLANLTGQEQGHEAGQTKLLELVRKYPNLESLYQLMSNDHRGLDSSQQGKDISTMAELLSDVVEAGKNYHCRQCGFQSNALHWQCPGCKGWGTIRRQSGVKLAPSP
ncbi:MAG: lipopolysaccharide assembly protein LapB [Gammaproteobacteria bacterium]|nr:lipopolysaccharide assembly protein LapB [Gammaproteobacteria bacterium]